jgi:hypothetical protein
MAAAADKIIAPGCLNQRHQNAHGLVLAQRIALGNEPRRLSCR